MPRIHTLDPQLVSRIAAGEVIERPVYAIKELVENALDADADQIIISIENHGLQDITVFDTGHGMSAEDLVSCTLPHTTSKLNSEEMLASIPTLGFRGEALHSIAAISQMTISSRERGVPHGHTITIENSTATKPRKAGIPEGTTVTVQNLFHNSPVRRSFLKEKSLEYRGILEYLTAVVLAHPGVGFRFSHNGSLVFDIPRGYTLEDRIARLLGDEILNDLIALRSSEMYDSGSMADHDETGKNRVPKKQVHNTGGSCCNNPTEDGTVGEANRREDQTQKQTLRITGYIARPRAQGNRSGRYLYVNGRPVQHSALAAHVKHAYGSLLDPRQQPMHILFITIPHHTVDVNIHPRKEQVRFNREQELLGVVRHTVLQTLTDNRYIYKLPATEVDQLRDAETTSAAARTIKREYLGLEYRHSPDPDLPITQANNDNPIETLTFDTRDILQIHNLYLVVPSPRGLVVIDQHAAHERILYEQFMNRYHELIDQSARSRPEKAIILELSHSDAEVLTQHLDSFTALGFELEQFGDTHIKVNAIPSILSDRDVAGLITDIIEDLKEGLPAGSPDARTNRMISFLACRSAIKAGDVLTKKRAKELLNDLAACKTGYSCPHGRPVFLELSNGDLARLFRRK